MSKKVYSVNTSKENIRLHRDLGKVITKLTSNDVLFVTGENADCRAEYEVRLFNILGNDMLVVGMSGNGREFCEFFDEENVIDVIDWLLENMCFEYLGEKYKLTFYKEDNEKTRI